MYRDLPADWGTDDIVRGAEALAAVGVSTLVTGAVGHDPAGWLESTFGPALDRIHAIEPASSDRSPEHRAHAQGKPWRSGGRGVGAPLKSWSPSTTKNVRSSVDSITASMRSWRVCFGREYALAQLLEVVGSTSTKPIVTTRARRPRPGPRGCAPARRSRCRGTRRRRSRRSVLPSRNRLTNTTPSMQILPVDPVLLRSMAE